MATANVRMSVMVGTNGTTWVNTVLAVDGTFGTNNATYCTWTNATRRGIGYIELGGNFASIPAGSTVNSVTATLRHYESNTTNIPTVQIQPYVNGTALGTIFTAGVATSARSDTNNFGAILIDSLQDPTFVFRVTATRANNTTSAIFYLDYVDVVVDYTPPAAAPTEYWGVAA